MVCQGDETRSAVPATGAGMRTGLTWRRVGSCLDYQAYILDLPPGISGEAYGQLDRHLRGLGRLEQELLGVAYIRGDWGVVIVPPPGFPEIKMKIHHHVGDGRTRALLTQVQAIVERALAITEPPEEDHNND